ncbi:MAG: SMC-Scp complex subunit ScpB [Phycisphaerales bacterium]
MPHTSSSAHMDEPATPVDIEAAASSNAGSGQQQPCSDLPLALRIEALLFSSDRPLSDGRLAELIGLALSDGGTEPVREAIEHLNELYARSGRSFRIESVAGGRQVLTTPEYGPLLHRLHQSKAQSRLSPAALETLAIVAYRQPVLRADVEAIRGVACGEVLRTLMERRLVKITGRAEEIGRPMLYGTTREFLHVFGLASLDDLPQSGVLTSE